MEGVYTFVCAPHTHTHTCVRRSLHTLVCILGHIQVCACALLQGYGHHENTWEPGKNLVGENMQEMKQTQDLIFLLKFRLAEKIRQHMMSPRRDSNRDTSNGDMDTGVGDREGHRDTGVGDRETATGLGLETGGHRGAFATWVGDLNREYVRQVWVEDVGGDLKSLSDDKYKQITDELLDFLVAEYNRWETGCVTFYTQATNWKSPESIQQELDSTTPPSKKK